MTTKKARTWLAWCKERTEILALAAKVALKPRYWICPSHLLKVLPQGTQTPDSGWGQDQECKCQQNTDEESQKDTTLLYIRATPSALCKITGFRPNSNCNPYQVLKVHAENPCILQQQTAPRINILNSKPLRCKGTKCQNCGLCPLEPSSCVTSLVMTSWQCFLSNKWQEYEHCYLHQKLLS